MKFYYWIGIALLFFGCQSQNPKELKKLLDDFQKEMIIQFPDYAAAMGTAGANEILVIPTKERLKKNRQFCQDYQQVFNKYPDFEKEPELNEKRQETLEVINSLSSRLNGNLAPENNPAYFDVLPALRYRLMQIQNGEDKEKNLFIQTLKKIPDYYETAKEVLENPDMENTSAAISLSTAAFSFIHDRFPKVINSEPSLEKQQLLTNQQERVLLAIKDYRAFCNSILVELKRLERG